MTHQRSPQTISRAAAHPMCRLVESRFAAAIWRLPMVICGIVALTVGCDRGDEQPVAQPVFVREIPWAENGVWLKADTHTHSNVATGTRPIIEIAGQAAKYGCDVIAVTDNGSRRLGSASKEYFRELQTARQRQSSVMIIAGLEWNVPPYDDRVKASVLFPQNDSEAVNLKDFKERYDDLGLVNHESQRAQRACQFLAELSGDGAAAPVLMLHNPSLETKFPHEVVDRVTELRKEHPVLVGMTGAPGRQAAASPGEYPHNQPTIDRWDRSAAEVGGAWDVLLQQGQFIWAARAPSDFQNPAEHGGTDYWPGQFSETWLYAPERSIDGALRALAAGSFFGEHGHIVRELQLQVSTANLPRPAIAGEEIAVAPGSSVTISVTGAIPETDWAGAPNRIDALELILITDDSIEDVTRELPASNRVNFEHELTVPENGVTVRVRGRRKIADGPDLMFYSNPLKVSVITPDEPETESRLTTVYGILAGIGLLFVAALIVVRRQKRSQTYELSTYLRPAPLPTRTVSVRGFFWGTSTLLKLTLLWPVLLAFDLHFPGWEQTEALLRQLPAVDLSVEQRAEWMTRLLLYGGLTFSGLSFALVQRSGKFAQIAWTTVMVLGVAVYGVALTILQLWSATLNASWNEPLAAGLGSIAGAIVWWSTGPKLAAWMTRYRTVTDGVAFSQWLLVVYLVVWAGQALFPLDLMVHPVELTKKYEAGRVLGSLFADPDFGLNLFFVNVMLTIPVGWMMSMIGLQSWQSRRFAAESIGLGACAVVAVNLAKLLLFSVPFDSTTLLANLLGVTVGAALSRVSWRRVLPPLAQAVQRDAGLQSEPGWNVVFIGYAVLLCFLLWWPFEVELKSDVVEAQVRAFVHLPFSRGGSPPEFAAAVKLLLFVPLGIALARVLAGLPLPAERRRLFERMGWLLCIAFGLGIELVQTMLRQHSAGMTDVILYAIGAWIGMAIIFRERSFTRY